ncbi:MAG TPA: hypothetical protein VIY53_04890 [Acidobacteriaceae bacterium]
MGRARVIWESSANRIWVALALFVSLMHLAVKHTFSQFTPPASTTKPEWIRSGLWSELAFHVAVLGAVITAVRNRIPSLKEPAYSDDGTLSIGSPQEVERDAKWGEIAVITAEFVLYLAVWAWLYRLI